MIKHESMRNLWQIKGLDHPMKGKIPWNKGKKVDREKYPNMGHFIKHSESAIERMKLNHHHLSAEKIKSWKGECVGYRALHDWVARYLGKPLVCQNCGDDKRTRYHWANISHLYKRDTKDWIRLCPRCHYYFDRGGGLEYAKA